ncbi:hypothetical protein V9T40_010077 [Parthenolecanium corni]|uniref:A to I editase domain-containing protein n=1 Tax=Parthenolecanium corni TaxID=536013 RepID=A0AAN9TLK9_9HEMI
MLTTTKRSSTTSTNFAAKRRKLKDTSLDTIRKYINSEKGEAIQALYMVFESGSFSFETHQKNNLPCKFVTYLNLEGYTFIGYGNTKVSSRSSASRIALLHLLDDSTVPSSKLDDYRPQLNVPLVSETSHFPEDLPDVIASLVLSKYDELRNAEKSNLPWFKVISGIVMIRNNDYKNGRVVVMSTGTKCIEPKNLQTNGCVLIDSHAEILCRRALRLFLYTQIESSRDGIASILHHNGSKFEIEKDISLYLFISSAPCGDSRIFTVSGQDKSVDKHPNRVCRGVLRIKLDGGNSTVPVIKYETDSRLMVMSCSDKLLKMNVLGLQGSLLSNFVEPIYLSGVIIGDSFPHSHASRALYERIASSDFPNPFRLNKVTIFGVHKAIKSISTCPKLNVNWICESTIEITNSTNGKVVDGTLSRLCKYRLFEQFLKIYRAAGEKNDLGRAYDYFKSKAVHYQKTKEILYQLLEAKKLGKWIQRNRIFNQFTFMSSD